MAFPRLRDRSQHDLAPRLLGEHAPADRQHLVEERLWRLLRFGHGTVSDLVRTAIEPAPYVSELCERLSISTALAPVALRASLEHRLEVLAPDSVPEAACLLTRALEELAAAGG